MESTNLELHTAFSNFLQAQPQLVAQTIALSGSIHGWFSEKEAAALFACAVAGTSDDDIVEIGSFKGRSTVCLARGCQITQRGKVYAIDPQLHDPSTVDEFRENMKRLSVDQCVVQIVATSAEAAKNWNRPIRLLFIDGDHSIEHTEQDFLLWSPHVISGGLIAFHDVAHKYPGPRYVVEKYVKESGPYVPFAQADTLFVAWKR